MNEFEIIQRFFSESTHSETATSFKKDESSVFVGIGDDCAIVQPQKNEYLAISVDTSVAGVHFPFEAPADIIGYRALAVSLSDLAAMGAQPCWYLLALILPKVDEYALEQMSTGLHQLAQESNIRLIGGDISAGPTLSLSVTVMGSVPHSKILRRNGAQANQLICVSGVLGGAYAGLKLWEKNHRDLSHNPFLNYYFKPKARLSLGLALRGLASSVIDISDGLLADLTHLCQSSGVGARLELSSIPFAPDLALHFGETEALKAALQGGDDYELLFTIEATHLAELKRRIADQQIGISIIGETTESCMIQTQSGQVLANEGWQHFKA